MENNENDRNIDSKLAELRSRIDCVDDRIKNDFSERLNLAVEISKYKKDNNLPAVDKTREHEIVNRLSADLDDKSASYLKVLYSTIFDISRAHQVQSIQSPTVLTKRLSECAVAERKDTIFPSTSSVACQGTDGSYSQITCDDLFKRANIMYCLNDRGVFQAVDKGLTRFGVVAIENSAQGSIKNIYNFLKEYDVHIVKSIRIGIRHAALAKKIIPDSEVREIVTYRHALSECSEYIKSFKNAKITICENTAEAAKITADNPEDNVIAVSSAVCAPIYGLKVVKENVQNNNENYTRFICFEKGLKVYDGSNKMSLIVTVPHKSGSLYDLVSKFAALGMNITKIESRPIRHNHFEQEIYLDFEADIYSAETLNLLSNLESTSDSFYFLGCYSEV